MSGLSGRCEQLRNDLRNNMFIWEPCASQSTQPVEKATTRPLSFEVPLACGPAVGVNFGQSWGGSNRKCRVTDAAGNIAPRNFILTGRGSFYFDVVQHITWKHPQ